ncbi:MAG: STAS-like domain-containing protein [Taibaiella sp.]|nr:STAS-like domain-containing protein [Taibaiella sp.]
MTNTNTVNVKEVIKSTVAVTPDAGEELYAVLRKNLKEDIETYIDFSNIDYLTSAFLNSAIGQLYSEYSREELNTHLHVLNLSENDLKIFKKVTDRARHFFKNEDLSRNDLKDIIDE